MGWGEPYGSGPQAPDVQGGPHDNIRIPEWGQPWPYPPMTGVASAICPDLLDHAQLGEADNLRGRVVRAFFWLMRLWPS